MNAKRTTQDYDKEPIAPNKDELKQLRKLRDALALFYELRSSIRVVEALTLLEIYLADGNISAREIEKRLGSSSRAAVARHIGNFSTRERKPAGLGFFHYMEDPSNLREKSINILPKGYGFRRKLSNILKGEK